MSAFKEAVQQMKDTGGWRTEGKPEGTAQLIAERGTTHGSFIDNARYGQHIRDLCRSSRYWDSMPAEHREALDMIACKLSRILSGQSTFGDHWDDISGYALLARKECK